MPDGPHLQAERAFVQANDREVDFCPFRGPGARLPRTDTIPLLAAEINPAFGGDQEQAHGPQSETNSSQSGIDGRVARCATRGNNRTGSTGARIAPTGSASLSRAFCQYATTQQW